MSLNQMTTKDEAIAIMNRAIEMMNEPGDPIAVRADRVRTLLNERLTDDQMVDVKHFMAFGDNLHPFLVVGSNDVQHLLNARDFLIREKASNYETKNA